MRWNWLLVLCLALPAEADELFRDEVWPIFARRCITCHGGVKPKGGVSFVYPETILPPGEAVVVPGAPERSELFRRISSGDPAKRMPPAGHGEPLTKREVETIRHWIRRGAPWSPHWAFRMPTLTVPHDPTHGEWCRSGLDCWVQRQLRVAGLYPAAPAPRLQWLRRVCFDLTGLPPGEDLIRSFLADRRPDAAARVVDRLLASPAYGERWASPWLDLARYADSQGYEKDNLRTMWPYRDWVIRSLNADLPFDRFTIVQLAGDLLADHSLDDEIATAFHRNTPTNAEGGTDDEEFRTLAVIDRVNTTWEVWLGLTFKCVQCHDHPYLPIRHREYYEFYALFNTTRDWDLMEDVPLLPVPTDRRRFKEARALDAERQRLEALLVQQTRQRAEQTAWYYLRPVYADSTYLTELRVRQDERGVYEIHTAGTVSHDSKFTLLFELPSGLHQVTALLIEVLPRDPEKAVHTPELGFVLSELKAYLVPAQVKDPIQDGRPVTLRWALGDETMPFGDPMATLKPDKAGWGAKPRITHPRRLVVVPDEPLSVAPGVRLRLEIRQEDAGRATAPLVMNRSRYAVTDDAAWTRWTSSPPFQQRMTRLEELKRQRAAIPSVMLPVMREQDPWLRRQTAVFRRGNWQEKTEPVEPALPRLIGSGTAVSDRLALARWLVGRRNPLTARVVVNRVWYELFGAALVSTPDDFGPMSPPPTNPGLLDYLAVRFRDHHAWSLKRLLREITLSATYGQDARGGQQVAAEGLLARGPRQRLTAEMIRDNALAVSGLLSRRMYGPPVMPPQPPGLWRVPYNKLRWKAATDENRYRRAVYVMWRRSIPYPSFMIFDAPQRTVCSSQRIPTNTPLQALVTLNDEAYVECARALAERVVRDRPGRPAAESVARIYELATGRAPQSETIQLLLDVHEYALQEYRNHSALARQLAGNPELAALTLVANTVLNLDEVLTR